jgi:D-threo-aldose 1-dehydrogenase
VLTRPVGRSGTHVTELGFGSAAIGNLYNVVPTDTALATVTAAWDAGIRYFDTAPHYGLGLAEKRLGAALAGRPRDEYVVSTKVGRLLEAHPAPTGSDLATGGFAVRDDLMRVWDLSADGVRRSIEASLARMALDRIDIVLVHDPDQGPDGSIDQVVSETVPALLKWRDEGIVGAIGVGMNQWQGALQLVRQGEIDAVMLSGRWTLLDRSGGILLDACAEQDVAVLAAAPYNSGLLATDRLSDDARFDYGSPPAEVLRRRHQLATEAAALGIPLPAFAVKFPLLHAATASVVVGLRSPDEVTAAKQRYATSISDAQWVSL